MLLALSLGIHPIVAHADDAAHGSLTPWAGMYVPTRNHYSTVEGDIKRKSAFMYGGQMSWYPRGPLGLELAAGFSPARTQFAGATVNEFRNLDVFVASARLLVGVSPALSPVSVFAKAGPAYVRHSDPRDPDKHLAEWGGVLGMGMRFPFTRAVGLRLDGEDYMYGGRFDGTRKFQNDLVFSAGVSFGM